jgi:hypothetical protein
MSVDAFDFGSGLARSHVTNKKSRLTSHPEFPIDLADLIESAGRGSYKLHIDPTKIRLFFVDTIEVTRELVS